MHTLENDSDTIQYRKTRYGNARALLNTPHPVELDALPLVFLLVAHFSLRLRRLLPPRRHSEQQELLY
jgi:hypothetical protein